MNKNLQRVYISLGVFIAWVAITLSAIFFQNIPNNISADQIMFELVSTKIAWHTFLAAIFLFIVIKFFKWNDIGLNTKPQSLFKVLWFPSLYLLIFLGLILTSESSLNSTVIVFIFLNSLLVGISEELMFRGILFQALNKIASFWTTIFAISLSFGAIHTLNVLTTGDLMGAISQALSTTIIGFALMAIYLRTNSIWVAIFFHCIWDTLIFILIHGLAQTSDSSSSIESGINMGVLIIFAPMFIYGLIMLRSMQNKTN